MLFQKSQMCFNEPDYVTVHSVMNMSLCHEQLCHDNKRCQNGAKMPQQCF